MFVLIAVGGAPSASAQTLLVESPSEAAVKDTSTIQKRRKKKAQRAVEPVRRAESLSVPLPPTLASSPKFESLEPPRRTFFTQYEVKLGNSLHSLRIFQRNSRQSSEFSGGLIPKIELGMLTRPLLSVSQFALVGRASFAMSSLTSETQMSINSANETDSQDLILSSVRVGVEARFEKWANVKPSLQVSTSPTYGVVANSRYFRGHNIWGRQDEFGFQLASAMTTLGLSESQIITEIARTRTAFDAQSGGASWDTRIALGLRSQF